jgi:hypothetical protein
LGPKLGPLTNLEIVDPDDPGNLEAYPACGQFCAAGRLLGPISVLSGFLDWLIARHASRPLTLSHRGRDRAGWDFLIHHVGETFLEKVFPPIPRQGPPEIDGYESECGWLEDTADQLRVWLPRICQYR